MVQELVGEESVLALLLCSWDLLEKCCSCEKMLGILNVQQLSFEMGLVFLL